MCRFCRLSRLVCDYLTNLLKKWDLIFPETAADGFTDMMLIHTLGEGQGCPEITWVHANRVDRGKALGAVWRRERVQNARSSGNLSGTGQLYRTLWRHPQTSLIQRRPSFPENSKPFRKAAEQSETDEDGLKVLRQSQGFLVSTISKDGQAITSVTYNLRVLVKIFLHS